MLSVAYSAFPLPYTFPLFTSRKFWGKPTIVADSCSGFWAITAVCRPIMCAISRFTVNRVRDRLVRIYCRPQSHANFRLIFLPRNALCASCDIATVSRPSISLCVRTVTYSGRMGWVSSWACVHRVSSTARTFTLTFAPSCCSVGLVPEPPRQIPQTGEAAGEVSVSSRSRSTGVL